MKISIVVPVFNEQGNLAKLAERLSQSLVGLNVEYIFVNDGSTDSSVQEIKKLSLREVTLLSFSRNFGHQAALEAGMRAAEGDFVVSLDSDLQHPPELIPQMIEKALQEEVDVVYAVRKSRQEETFFKRASSRFYYSALRKLTGFQMRESAADFRLISKRCLQELLIIPSPHAVYRVLIPSLNLREAEITYVAAPRYSGETKYTRSKMLKLAITSVVAYSKKPLYLSLATAFVALVLSLAGGVYVISQWLFEDTIVGWASTVSLLLMMFGLISMNLGIVSLYLARLIESQNRLAPYLIEETWQG